MRHRDARLGVGLRGSMHQRFGQFPGYTVREALDSPRHYEWYLATEDSTRQWVEIKSLSRDLCNVAELRLFFQDACRRYAHARTDGIIAMREIGISRQFGVYAVYPYAFSSLTIGEMLAIANESRTLLPPAFCASVLLDAARILDNAHRQGLTHYSLMPHDIFISDSGETYVQGFVEAAMRRKFRFDTELDEKFDAPEVRKCEPHTEQSDIYAIGAYLYQGIVNRIQPDEWEPCWMGMMDTLNRAQIPGDSLMTLMHFFQHTLAERPQQRFPSYSALAQAIEQFIAEIGDYVPAEVRAQMMAEHFDAYPPEIAAEAPRSDVISLITGDFPSISAELSTPDSGNRLIARLSDGLKKGTAAGGAPSSAGSFEETLTTSPYETPETRVLHRSSASFRTISPSLRATMTASPLEILARSRYQILDKLGTGGTGTVYKALDTTLSEILALKVLRPELVADAAWLQRFKRELKVTRDLEHVNILQAYHLEQIDGLYFYTMRYIDGKNLSELIHGEGARIPLMMSLKILTQVAQALVAAHERGVIHRDLKPANIMIERDTFHPYLMDFGIASAPDLQSITIAGQGIGTPFYMAPEQSRGEPISVQADIYSFGVMAYECFTKRLPFEGATAIAIYTAQQSGVFVPLRELNPNVPEGVARTVESCMSPRAADRPINMNAVLEGLRKL